MPTYATINGVQKELTAIPAMVDGVQRELSFLFATIDGVAREIFASGYKWERYSVAKELVIESVENAYIQIVQGDKVSYPSSTIDDSALQLSTDGNYVILNYSLNSTIFKSLTTAVVQNCAYNVDGKWFFHNVYSDEIDEWYSGDTEAYYGNGRYDGSAMKLGYSRIARPGTTKADFIDTVTSADITAYPVNGVHTDGYWYVLISDVSANVSVTVTDSSGTQSGLSSLLTSKGALTVGGVAITSGSQIVTVQTGEIEVVYTLTSALTTGRTLYVNGTAIGSVSSAGTTLRTTVTVSDSDEITIHFAT